MRYAYLNGAIVPETEATISPLDIGLLRGYAVFDLLRTVSGRPFLLAEHLERLESSADALGLRVPVTADEIARAIDELLARNGHAEATVRLVLTGGISADGMGFDPATPTFLILTHELKEPPASLYERGGKLVTRLHRRELPEAKTTNYLTMLANRPGTTDAGALDTLYHDGERIFEAATANVYAVKDGAILVPHRDVLHGTVGELVLSAAEATHRIERRDVSLDEVFSADEVLLTSTTRGVVPIVAIDDRVIGEGRPGPVARELMALWAAALRSG